MSGTIAAYGEGFNFQVASPAISDTSPEYPGASPAVGTLVAGTNGSEWVRIKAGGTIAAGDVVIITTNSTWIGEAMTNTLAAGKLGQWVGVAGAAATVDQFLWMQVAGYTAAVNAATGMTGFTATRSTSTAGRIDDTISGGTTVAIAGIVILATAASNTAAALLNHPTVGAND